MKFKSVHGKCFTRVYSIWQGMKKRCLYKKHNRYKYYGAKGITVCEAWLKFENFYKDMGDPPTSKHTLNRIDNDKGYSPENCNWATYAEQNRNYSLNRKITFNGETLTITDWEKRVGGRRGVIFSRLKLGWSEEKAITTSVRKWNKH